MCIPLRTPLVTKVGKNNIVKGNGRRKVRKHTLPSTMTSITISCQKFYSTLTYCMSFISRSLPLITVCFLCDYVRTQVDNNPDLCQDRKLGWCLL